MSFDDREKAFENKHAHQEQLDFAVEARSCKLFGLWIAEKFGLEGADANTYAMEVVESNLEEAGFEDVYRKVRKDLDAKGVELSDHMMSTEMNRFVAEAKKQIAEKG